MNEDGDRQTLSDNILENMQKNESDLFPTIIFDETGFASSHDPKRLQKFIETGKMKKFESLDELAAGFKLNVQILKEEIKRYNENVVAKTDADFKKDLTKVAPIEKAPFYAILGIPGISYTPGGVRVNLNFEVLNINDSKPIKNLYAVGEATGGVHGFARLTSCSTPDCISSAMIAAEHILKG